MNQIKMHTIVCLHTRRIKGLCPHCTDQVRKLVYSPSCGLSHDYLEEVDMGLLIISMFKYKLNTI